MSEKTPSKGLGIVGLILGLGALAGMAFVLFEPIAAYDRLAKGVYSFPPAMRDSLMAGRMREAGIPLIGSSVGAVLAFILAKKAGGKLGLVGMIAGLIAVAAAAYVWAAYGEGIIRRL